MPIPDLKSLWSASDANNHYVRVLVLAGPDSMTSGSNGDRHPAPDVAPPGGAPAAPGFPPHPSGFATTASPDVFSSQSPLWALIFGGM